MTRDLTEQQYQAALKRYGFESEGFMGYYKLPLTDQHIAVCSLNAGERRRDRLAYLLGELARHQ